MAIPSRETEGSESLPGQIIAAMLSNPAGRWLAVAVAVALLILAIRLKDLQFRDWVIEFDRPPAARAAPPMTRTNPEMGRPAK